MLQDNQKSQYCRELGARVYEALINCKESLSVIEELSYMYKPKSQEEAGKLCRLQCDLPGSVALLCELRKMNIPDDVEFYDLVAPLRDVATDIANHMVCVDVIVNDIIKMVFEPHDNEINIYLYLTMLKSLSNNIYYMRVKMDNLHKETSKKFPELLQTSDDSNNEDEDEEEEEETVLPGEVVSFQSLRRILLKTLAEYAKKNEPESISGFILAIQDYLKKFSKGIEPDNEFDFSFACETGIGDNNEMEYIDFHFEVEMIQVSCGGSVYDKDVGSDSYTNWDYSISLNGWDEDNQDYRFSTMLELVRNGAKLSIESPD